MEKVLFEDEKFIITEKIINISYKPQKSQSLAVKVSNPKYPRAYLYSCQYDIEMNTILEVMAKRLSKAQKDEQALEKIKEMFNCNNCIAKDTKHCEALPNCISKKVKQALEGGV